MFEKMHDMIMFSPISVRLGMAHIFRTCDDRCLLFTCDGINTNPSTYIFFSSFSNTKKFNSRNIMIEPIKHRVLVYANLKFLFWENAYRGVSNRRQIVSRPYAMFTTNSLVCRSVLRRPGHTMNLAWPHWPCLAPKMAWPQFWPQPKFVWPKKLAWPQIWPLNYFWTSFFSEL